MASKYTWLKAELAKVAAEEEAKAQLGITTLCPSCGQDGFHGPECVTNPKWESKPGGAWFVNEGGEVYFHYSPTMQAYDYPNDSHVPFKTEAEALAAVEAGVPLWPTNYDCPTLSTGESLVAAPIAAPDEIEGVWRHADDGSPCSHYPDSFGWMYVSEGALTDMGVTADWTCAHDRAITCHPKMTAEDMLRRAGVMT